MNTRQPNSIARAGWQQRLLDRYGTWAVVTGASSGIGREMAIQLAAAGFNLVLVARSRSILEDMAADFDRQYGSRVRVLPLDLVAETSVKEIVSHCEDLDIGLIVAAAGFGTSGAFLAADLERELEMLAVNCRSIVALCWYFGQRLAARGRGGMVLMSSIVGFQGMPHAAHYAATKAYVQTLAEALHVELAPQGIDVIASAPGPTQSGFADRAGMKMGKTIAPQLVARETLQALMRRRATVLPGWLSKLLVYSLVPLPRWVRVRIMGGVMRGMTRHQQLN